MAKLTAGKRNALTAELKARVRAKVHKKFPTIGK